MATRVLLISLNRCTVPDTVYPIGIAYLSAALRSAGHTAKLLDLLAEPDGLIPVLREFQPEVVGLSLRNIDNVLIRQPEVFFADLPRIVQSIRENHKCTIVIGGSGFSVFPEVLLQKSGADFGIHGEGEGSLVALLAALESGAEPAQIPGLVFRRGVRVIRNPGAGHGHPPPILPSDRKRHAEDHCLWAAGTV